MRKRKPDLTKRQKEVLAILRSELLRHRYAPTMREIAAKAGLASTSSVKYQLDELEEKGYVRRDPRRPRTILLTEKGLEGTHRTTRGDYTNAGLPRGAREAEEEGAEESEASVADAPRHTAGRRTSISPSPSRWWGGSRPAPRSSPISGSTRPSRCPVA